VVTLYRSESGLHPRGGFETGIICPAQVAVAEPDVVDVTDVVVAVAPTEINRVAADVVKDIDVEQFPWISVN
jgi:hypothetical protein